MNDADEAIVTGAGDVRAGPVNLTGYLEEISLGNGSQILRTDQVPVLRV